MYVCLCEAISERSVRKAIARGATTVHEVGRACGAGRGCGGCVPVVEAMLEEAGHDCGPSSRSRVASMVTQAG